MFANIVEALLKRINSAKLPDKYFFAIKEVGIVPVRSSSSNMKYHAAYSRNFKIYYGIMLSSQTCTTRQQSCIVSPTQFEQGFVT